MNQLDTFLHHANLERFRNLLANTTDEVQRQTLQNLLAAEVAKNRLPSKTA